MNKNATQKQAFFFTVINYVGILVGIVSTLFIYPNNKELLGVFRYIDALAQLLFPILLLGASQALVNFNPKISTQQQKKLFNFSIVSILSISVLLLLFIYFTTFLPFLKGIKYVYFSFAVAVFLAFIELLKKQSAIIQKIAIPTLFDALIPKITLPLIFILLLYNTISVQQSLILYLFSFGLILVMLCFYLFYFFKPEFDLDFKPLFTAIPKTDYYRFALYAFAGSLGSVFAFRIDAIMIKNFYSLTALGTFSIGVTLASALAVPATGIFVLYAPKVSNYLKNNQFLELNIKYKEIAKLLFFIGSLLYSCIFLGIENLFSLLPTSENLMESVPIILILGANVLINMATGFNGEIITYSKYYRFNLVAIAILIVLNVGLNLLFIVYFKLGIEAVAFASLVSMVLFNIAKLLFIYKKMKLFPFDYSYLKLIAVVGFVLIIVNYLPSFNSNLINLTFKTAICLFLNLILIYKLNLVYSYNFWIDKLHGKIISKV